MTRKEAMDWFEKRQELPLDNKCKAAEKLALLSLIVDEQYGLAYEDAYCANAINRNAAINAIKNTPLNFKIKSDSGLIKYINEIQELVNKILNAQEEALNNIQNVLPKQDWISVKERLPKEGKSVLVTKKYGEKCYVTTAIYIQGCWLCNSEFGEVIAWMEYPREYEEVNDDYENR